MSKNKGRPETGAAQNKHSNGDSPTNRDPVLGRFNFSKPGARK